MTSFCCSFKVSVILQSCKDQEIFIRCWYVKPYNWKLLLFHDYIFMKNYKVEHYNLLCFIMFYICFLFFWAAFHGSLFNSWWTVSEAAAVLDKLQEKDLISNEKYDAVRNLNEPNERLFKDELYEVQEMRSLRFLIDELEGSQCIV